MDILTKLIYCSDLGQVNAYLASTEEGGWEDVAAAGCK